MENSNFKVGIDFNGVIFEKDYNRNFKIKEYCSEILKELKNINCELFLISACGKKKAVFRNQLLIENNVGHLLTNQYFLGTKKFKSFVCNDIGCHFMIDDKVEVLNQIKKYNKKIITILFLSTNCDEQYAENDENNFEAYEHKIVKNWIEIYDIIKECSYFEQEITPIKNKNKIIKQIF